MTELTRYQMYINGEWVDPLTNETCEVINPATEEPIASIALGGKQDVDAAVSAAKTAFTTFSQTSVEERLDLLLALARHELAEEDVQVMRLQ